MNNGFRSCLVGTVIAANVMSFAGASALGTTESTRGDSFLNGVAAVSPTSAWAVGATFGDGVYQGFVQHWDGTGWTTALVDSPTWSVTEWLGGVAASSDTDVWTVGAADDSNGHTRAVILHWDGVQWMRIRTGHLHLGWDAQLQAVTALSPNDVWMVGSTYPSGRYKAIPVALHWDGSTLTQVDVPPPPRGQGFLSSVSATSSSDMWAVGENMWGSLRTKALIEHWDGSAWEDRSPETGQADISLVGVYAATTGQAWAIGYNGGPVIERYVRRTWTPVTLPRSFRSFEVYGISGTSADDVWVVGDDRAQNSSTTLTLHWDGAHWTRVTSPSFDTFSTLNAVAAGGGAQTWAVGGHSIKGSDDQAPVHELWTGHRWVSR